MLTEIQEKYIRSANKYHNNLVFKKINGKTLTSLIKKGFIEYYHEKKPFFSEGYRLTSKAMEFCDNE